LPASVGLLFGHARLAAIEKLKRCVHRIANLALRRYIHAVAVVKGGFDDGFEGGEIRKAHGKFLKVACGHGHGRSRAAGRLWPFDLRECWKGVNVIWVIW